jgi:ABC-type branched-subunit amino acid transport system permease subunit
LAGSAFLARPRDGFDPPDETAAEVMGIDAVRIKLSAFGIGAGIAGVAGALYAHRQITSTRPPST